MEIVTLYIYQIKRNRDITLVYDPLKPVFD